MSCKLGLIWPVSGTRSILIGVVIGVTGVVAGVVAGVVVVVVVRHILRFGKFVETKLEEERKSLKSYDKVFFGIVVEE